jgi:hypothetical protein
MTDDPNAAFIPHERNHPTMATPTDTLTSDTVRAALIELLTIGQHHHAATHTTLTAVGDTRRTLAALHDTHHPTAQFADDNQRIGALAHALDMVGDALNATLHPQHPDTAELRDGLTELAALTLDWLDALTDPPQPDQHR